MGAAIGRDFSYALLKYVAGRNDLTLSAALGQLEEAELLVRRGAPPEANYSFKHALVQETAYESLLKSKRQVLHTRIGDVLREKFPVVDLNEDLHDFSDTAAAILQLDLVISVETSITHLAGALGRPTWTMLCKASDWRYMRNRDDSPWYPTMRLFRQQRTGDWNGVVGRIAEALLQLLCERRWSRVRARLRGPNAPDCVS